MTLLNSGWGTRLLDYDNDGWKDLLVGQAHVMDTIERTYPQLHYRDPMLLARNTGQGFVDVSADSGLVFHEHWASRGMAIGDLDNDGADRCCSDRERRPDSHPPQRDADRNHWLTLNRVERKSNPDAIGAEVKLMSAAGEQSATVTTSGSYLSSSDKKVHFGLGVESVVKEIDIRWPSGIRQTLREIQSDQLLRVDEPVR